MLDVGVAKCPSCEVVCYCTGSNGTEISVCYTEKWGGALNVLKSMEIRSGHSEMSVITQVSAVEGRPLSGVPLYPIKDLCDN